MAILCTLHFSYHLAKPWHIITTGKLTSAQWRFPCHWMAAVWQPHPPILANSRTQLREILALKECPQNEIPQLETYGRDGPSSTHAREGFFHWVTLSALESAFSLKIILWTFIQVVSIACLFSSQVMFHDTNKLHFVYPFTHAKPF